MLRGAPLEEALRRTSDPEEYGRSLALSSQWAEHPAKNSPECNSLRTQSERLRSRLEAAFLEMLISGDLVANGFRHPINPDSRRTQIAADLWEVLEIDFMASEAHGAGLRMIRIEVLKPAINMERLHRMTPFRLEPIPDAAGMTVASALRRPKLSHNADFSVVTLGDATFKFGAASANVVRILHENVDKVGGWMHGKALMNEAGAVGTKVGDLFKRHEDPSWEMLIEGDGRGHYRLRLN